jgi:histidine triad (HIT) family protein
MPEDCVFCKIASGQIPVQPILDDGEFVAFQDMHPQAPVHVLLIPKQHYATLMDIDDVGLLGRALRAVQQTATKLGIADEGFRTVLNTRDNGGQTVHHIHWHILGGRFMQWPPG